MRPLKYKNLGPGVMIRVPESVTAVLPQLQEVMQYLEENDRDSVETITAVLVNILESISS